METLRAALALAYLLPVYCAGVRIYASYRLSPAHMSSYCRFRLSCRPAGVMMKAYIYWDTLLSAAFFLSLLDMEWLLSWYTAS